MRLSRRAFLERSISWTPGILVPGMIGLPWRDKGLHNAPKAPDSPLSDDWESIRRLYPLPEDRLYLNTGGLGPSPYPVMERFQRRMWDLQGRSETGHALIEGAREPVSAFFGVKPEEICFTRNATEGNSIVAAGLRLQTGDEVIIDSHAHPGGSIPWMTRWKENGVVVRIFEPHAEDPDVILDRIESLITDRTRVIQVSHITAPTGILLPVKRIAQLAHDRRLWFHIDGAQSAGALPIDLRDIGCDSWATSGHKWLGAPHGTGILFIQEERLDDVVPTEVGAYSDSVNALPDTFEYHPTARRFEPGTRSAPLADSIAASTEFMGQIGLSRVRARGMDLTAYLRSRLEAIDSIQVLTPRNRDLSGSILTFKSSTMPWDELNRELTSRHHLRLRVVTERNLDAIRASLHVFNLESDCDRIADGVADVLDG